MCCINSTPVLIDLDGDGFALTDPEHGVRFTLGGSGRAPMVAWTAPGSDDARLALDRNDNDLIDNGTELFGAVTPQPVPRRGQLPNGFLALAVYDTRQAGGNTDGRIDSRDRIYSSLRLWVDANHNGISEQRELLTLASRGVEAIDLKYQESSRVDAYGNLFKYRAKVYDSQQTDVGKWAWDVILLSRSPKLSSLNR